MIRFGLCCIFVEQPIRFRQTTAKSLLPLPRSDQLRKLSEICLHNSKCLEKALRFITGEGIGAFRILSPLLPRYTHPDVGYTIRELPDRAEIEETLGAINDFRAENDLRLSFHPDQFNVLSSPYPEVVRNSIRELEYQGMLAERVGAEIINVHAGGKYDSKTRSLERLKKSFYLLSDRVRARLSLENDDVSYTPSDLLPVCDELDIPFVYDVHHHRCLPDSFSEEEATRQCVSLWQRLGREPYFHISSPKNGWQKSSPKPHADYIDVSDFPPCWLKVNATVDVEAKAKELAVLRLKSELGL